MDISVIVPIYGVEKYIENSLRSIFSQTKTEGVEFILVNDCTRDRSMEIARDLVASSQNLNVVFIDQPKNGGVALARQAGLDAATGDYTIHFDPDDWCEPQMLEELYNCAIENDADIVGCDFYENYPNGQRYISQPFSNDGIECAHKLLRDKLHGSLWNKLIKRSLFSEYNIGFIPCVDLWEDKLISTKLFCCTNKISYLPKAYLHYVQNSDSIVHTMSYASLNNMVDAISDIEMYLQERGVSNDLFESLKISKIDAKMGILINLKGEQQHIAASMYPEVTDAIFRTDVLRLYWKVALYCASVGNLWVFNMIKFVILHLKTITKVVSPKNSVYEI